MGLDATKFPRLILYEHTKTIISLKYNFNIDLYDDNSNIMRYTYQNVLTTNTCKYLLTPRLAKIDLLEVFPVPKIVCMHHPIVYVSLVDPPHLPFTSTLFHKKNCQPKSHFRAWIIN